jgi:hypothetical protein
VSLFALSPEIEDKFGFGKAKREIKQGFTPSELIRDC